MKTVSMATTPKQRASHFLKAFQEAANDADIELRAGRTDDGTPAVLVSIVRRDFPLLATEARLLATIMERTMNKYPNDPEAQAMPNIIMGLRHAANEAEAEPCAKT